MKSIILIFSILATGILLWFVSQKGILTKTSQEIYREISPASVSPLTSVKLGENTLVQAEVARTVAEHGKGLSGRDSLAQNHGMLFKFPAKERYAFWMKGMRFSLDFLWITDGRVVEISEDLPAATTENPPTYTPSQPVDLVLEVNAGFAKKRGIKVGDRVQITSNENILE